MNFTANCAHPLGWLFCLYSVIYNAVDLAEAVELLGIIAVGNHPMVADALFHDLAVHLHNVALELDLDGVAGEFHAAFNGLAYHVGKAEILTVTADIDSGNRARLYAELGADASLGKTYGSELDIAVGDGESRRSAVGEEDGVCLLVDVEKVGVVDRLAA